MISLRKKSLRILVLAMLIFIIAVATYGFAAANTIEGGATMYMGEGSGTVAGFAVAVDFTVDLANPSTISAALSAGSEALYSSSSV